VVYGPAKVNMYDQLLKREHCEATVIRSKMRKFYDIALVYPRDFFTVVCDSQFFSSLNLMLKNKRGSIEYLVCASQGEVCSDGHGPSTQQGRG